MRILDKYMFKQLLLPIIYCSFALIMLLLLTDLFDNLDELVKNRTALRDIFTYYGLLVPYAFVNTISWATFLGTVYLLVTFNYHNEIIAMKVAGLNINRIIMPILFLGFVIGILTFVINDRVIPKTLPKAKEIKEREISKDIAAKKTKILKNVTYYGSENRIYFCKTLNAEKQEMEDIIVLYMNERKKPERKIVAKKAVWNETDKTWTLKNGSFYDINAKGKIIGEPTPFASRSFSEIKVTLQDLLTASRDVSILSYKSLKEHVDKLKKGGIKVYAESVELYRKMAFPWHSLVMILIAIPLLLETGSKRSIALHILICLAFVFAFHVLGAISLALGKSGTFPPFLSAWLNVLVFTGGGILALERGNF